MRWIWATSDENPPKGALRIALRVSAVMASLAVLWLSARSLLIVLMLNFGGLDGSAWPTDFSVFWGASRLAWAGNPTLAFDIDALNAAMDLPSSLNAPNYIWMYPPTFHLIVLPFGMLPFSASWMLFWAGGMVLLVRSLMPMSRILTFRSNVLLLSPTVFYSILNANTNLLTVAVFVFALRALALRSDLRAGVLIALLTIKPTLGLLIPFALIAGGHWRAFGWATTAVICFVLATVLAFGWEYWTVFFQALNGTLNSAADGQRLPLSISVTWFGWLVILGAGGDVALPVQICVTLTLVAATIWIWSRPNLPFAVKAGYLLIATPLATPYAQYYEMTYAIAGGMFLISALSQHSRLLPLMIAVVWLFPILVPVRDPPIISMIAAPLISVLLLSVLWSIARGQWKQGSAAGGELPRG